VWWFPRPNWGSSAALLGGDQVAGVLPVRVGGCLVVWVSGWSDCYRAGLKLLGLSKLVGYGAGWGLGFRRRAGGGWVLVLLCVM